MKQIPLDRVWIKCFRDNLVFEGNVVQFEDQFFEPKSLDEIQKYFTVEFSEMTQAEQALADVHPFMCLPRKTLTDKIQDATRKVNELRTQLEAAETLLTSLKERAVDDFHMAFVKGLTCRAK